MKARKLTKETINTIGITKGKMPEFRVGDTIAVSLRIKEGEKERLQVFEGDVIAMHNAGISTTITVRKISAHGVAVERIIPLHSPLVASVSVVKYGEVRRAKLYYVRDRLGKTGRLKERILTKEEKEQLADSAMQEQTEQ